MDRRTFFLAFVGNLVAGCAAETTASAGEEPLEATTSSSGDVEPTPEPPTTTSPTTSTSGPEPPEPPDDPSIGTLGLGKCGDGIVDPGETCDEGPQNSDSGACTHQCQKATCGDKRVWEGHEECDQGVANAEGYGKCLPGLCVWDSHCGDHVVDVGHEECDLGPDNGTGKGDEYGVPCSALCIWRGRIIFLSSESYQGDLGGLAGADAKCQELATSAGIGKDSVFRAWLSDGVDSPADRFAETSVTGEPYVLLKHGTIIAQDFDELTLTGPSAGISIDEKRQSWMNRRVWTNTKTDGAVADPDDHCNGWTSGNSTAKALVGYNAYVPDPEMWQTQGLWTAYQPMKCNQFAHLYCLEDGDADDG